MPESEDGKRDYPLDKIQNAPACAGAFCIGTDLGFVHNLAQQMGEMALVWLKVAQVFRKVAQVWSKVAHVPWFSHNREEKQGSDTHSEPHYFIKMNVSLSPRTNYLLILPF